MSRLRIFAGPNGSGKSTLFSQIKGDFNSGYYVNADELYAKLTETLLLDFEEFGLSVSFREWESFCLYHGLRDKAKLLICSHVESNLLVFTESPGSYEMAVLSDFIRQKLLKTGFTFSLETVFSHPSKLDFLKQALERKYRNYLYFTSLNDPLANVKRVQQRVLAGGHGVPKKKIIERYERTMNNLLPAMRMAHRSFIFDNSGSEMNLVLEVTPQKDILFKSKRIPVWVDEYVLSRLK